MEPIKTDSVDLRAVIRGAIEEFVKADQVKSEPAYKAELLEERRRREQLEQKFNELVHENQRTRKMAEETERGATIRAELQRLGVAKVDLAFRVVRDDIHRSEDGALIAKTAQGVMPMKEYLTQFVNENPELLPARIAGGSGMASTLKAPPGASGFDIDKIRPGMKPEDLDRVRQEISRLASQTLRGM